MPPQRPLVFEDKTKTNRWVKYIPWVFVALALAAIGTMILLNPPQPDLICQTNLWVPSSLLSFGTCVTAP